jgi:hypothetical protein
MNRVSRSPINSRPVSGCYAEWPELPDNVTRRSAIALKMGCLSRAAFPANELLRTADVRLPLLLERTIVEVPPFVPEVFWPLGAPSTPIGAVEAAIKRTREWMRAKALPRF